MKKSKIVWSLVLSFILIVIFFTTKNNSLEFEKKNLDEVSNKSQVQNPKLRKIASSDKKNVQVRDEKIEILSETSSDFMNISPKDPINELLTHYGINPKNQLAVNYDTWFISTRYSQVHVSEFYSDMGTVVENHNNFKIVELNAGINADNYPPLVVSYSTNRPIPITGDLLVKFQNVDDLDTLVSYLEDDSSFQDLIQNVVITPELKDIRWLLVKTRKKSEVMKLYSILSQKVGEYNIEAVQPDNRPQLKY
jgi:hypothetical protein